MNNNCHLLDRRTESTRAGMCSCCVDSVELQCNLPLTLKWSVVLAGLDSGHDVHDRVIPAAAKAVPRARGGRCGGADDASTGFGAVRRAERAQNPGHARAPLCEERTQPQVQPHSWPYLPWKTPLEEVITSASFQRAFLTHQHLWLGSSITSLNLIPNIMSHLIC